MKKGYTLIALASMALALASCADDFGMNNAGKYTGREIVFGSRASYEINEMGGKQNAPATRTVYTEEILNGDGETWSEGDGTKYEGVHWIPGDKVRVYCAEAAGVQTFDYSVTVSENTTNNITGLDKGNSEASLQWGGDVEHTFYAVYPTENAELTYDASTKNTKLTGEIPNIQVHKGENYLETSTTDGVTSYTVAPDMKYAYMMAKTVAKPSKEGVILRFMPIVTAVEITITNLAKSTDYPDGTTFHLANVLVSSANNESIYGQFEADFANITSDANGYGTGFTDTTDDPAITIAGDAGTQISLPMYTDGLYGDPIALAHGASITFTVFLLPTQDLDAIKVTIQGIDGNKTATISGGTFKITKRKKTYLNNLPLAGGTVLPFTQDEWLKYVEDEIVVNELSIPGAGGAASAEVANAIAEGKRQQNLNIEGLWNKGIRCFEFAVDIPSTDETADISGQSVICNGISCGITLLNAVQSVKNQLLAHPEEFAMVILSYQTMNGWAGFNDITRTPKAFMQQINKFWDEKIRSGSWDVPEGVTKPNDVTLGTELYNPSTAVVCTSRGKLFCIARPTSIHQDYGSCFVSGKTGTSSQTDKSLPDIGTVDEDIMVIQGWGNLKDKWQQRGYSNYSLRGSTAKVASDYDEKYGRPFDVATWHYAITGFTTKEWKSNTNGVTKENYKITPSNLTPDFYYDIQLGSNTTENAAWVQEWARVSNMTESAMFPEVSVTCLDLYNYPGCNKHKNEIFWGNSFDEKLQRVKECLDYAVNKKINGVDASNVTFINSLCGYYIDSSIADSYSPFTGTDGNISNGESLTAESATAGMEGDIKNFANDINQAFYNYLQTYTEGTGYTPGSMGIILMDRVGEIVGTNVGGDRIPGIIVANNFQHKTSASALSLRRDTYEDGDVAAAPQRREASESKSDEISIVWE